jgi:hypothetical protein
MLLFGKVKELTNGKKQRPIPDEICTVATKVSLLSGYGTLRPRSRRKSSFLLLKKRTGRRSLGVPRDDDSKSEGPCPEEELVKLLTSAKKESKATKLILYEEKKNGPPVPEPSSFWSSPIAFQLYLVIVIAILSGEPASFFQGMSIIMMLQSFKVMFQWAKCERCSTPNVQRFFLRSPSC